MEEPLESSTEPAEESAPGAVGATFEVAAYTVDVIIELNKLSRCRQLGQQHHTTSRVTIHVDDVTGHFEGADGEEVIN